MFTKKKNETFNVEYGKAYIPGLIGTPAHTDMSIAEKYSTALAIVDDYHAKKRVNVYASEGGKKIVYEREGEWGYFDADNNEVVFSKKEAKDHIGITPMVVYGLLTNSNLAEKFQSLYKEMTEDDILPSTREQLDYCDVFEYEVAYPAVGEGDIVVKIDDGSYKTQIDAAMRSGAFDKALTFVKEFNLGLGVFTPAKGAPNIGKKASQSESDLMADIKAGKYFVAYDWDEDQKKNIKPVDALDSFVPTKQWVQALKVVKKNADKALQGLDLHQSLEEMNCMVNGLLTGKPGTGKSMSVHMLGAATGMPVDVTAFTPFSDEQTTQGFNRIVDGKVAFVDSPFSKNWGKGGIHLFEEPNLIKGGTVMALLGQVIDKPYLIMRNGYEPVKRHPLSMVFMCQNAGIEGTNPCSPAILRRLGYKWIVDDPSPDVFKQIIMKNTGVDENVAERLNDAYRRIVEYIKDPENDIDHSIADALSVVQCIDVVKNVRDEEISTKDALYNVFCSSVANYDLETAIRLQSEVLDALPDFEID